MTGNGTRLLCALALSFAAGGCKDAAKPAPPAPAASSCTRSWKRLITKADVDLRGVWARSASEIWAVGENGVIFKCDANLCAVVEHDLANVLERIRGTTDGLYAGGWATTSETVRYDTRVYSLTDETWARTDPGFAGQLMDLWALSDARFVLSTYKDVGRISVERGGEWSTLDNPFIVPYSAWGLSSSDMYFAGRTKTADGALYRLVDGRLEAVTEADDKFYNTVFGVDGRLFVGGSDTQGKPIVGWLDKATLVTEDVDTMGIVRSIFGSSLADLWAVADGRLLQRVDEHWREVELPAFELPDDTRVYAGFSLDAKHTYAVGPAGAVLRYDCDAEAPAQPPKGCEWQAAESFPTQQFTALWRSGSGSLLVASLGRISSLDNGELKTLWSGGKIRIEAFAGVGSTSFAVGVSGDSGGHGALVVRCVDNDCERMDAPFGGGLYAVQAFAPDSVVAVGIDNNACSQIIRYDGTKWTVFPEYDCALTLRSIWGSSDTDIWAAGLVRNDGGDDFGRILHFDGKTWSVAVEHAPVQLMSMTGRSKDEVYAVGIYESAPFKGLQYGSIMRWDGQSWTEMLRDDARGFTYATLDDSGALWVGAQRWREIERDARAEVVTLRDGAESTTQLCADTPGRIVSLLLEPNGISRALLDEGQLFTLQAGD